MRRLLTWACLLAALAAHAVLPVAAQHAAVPAAKSTCDDHVPDVHYVFVVNAVLCDFYAPGNTSLWGPAAVAVTGRPSAMATCLVINNTFPGPTVRATLGQLVRVDVINNIINSPITVHWHGLSMKGYAWADGTGMVNSCPIAPGRPQTYLFRADAAGTYFYHGHAGLEEEYGIGGAIIIDDPRDPYTDLYDEEFPNTTLQIRDWWREPLAHMSQGLDFLYYEKFDPFGIPLINGYYGNGTRQLPHPVFYAAPDTCYRTRILVSNTEWPGWSINITDAQGDPMNMTLLALTAQNLQPSNTQNLAVYLAQRAEIVLCTPSTPQDLNFSMWSASTEAGLCVYNGTASPLNPGPVGSNCIDHFSAIIRVGGLNATGRKTANRTKLSSLPFYHTIDSLINSELVMPLTPVMVPENTHNTTWKIKTGIVVPGIMYAWDERLYQYTPATAPLLYTLGTCGTTPTRPSTPAPSTLSKRVLNNDVVDIVFENLSPFMHPMHLHGYQFTVLGSKYLVPSGYEYSPQTVCPNGYMWANPANDGKPLSDFTTLESLPFLFGCPYNDTDPTNADHMLSTPYMTDIVPVPAHSWAIVRVKFDNPGMWYLHCHINAHMIGGMGFVVDVESESLPPIPSWVDTSCGGACTAVDQFCGPYAHSSPTTGRPRCVRATSKRRDICTPSGFVPLK